MALQISHENNFSQFYPHLLPQLISFDHSVMSEMPFFILSYALFLNAVSSVCLCAFVNMASLLSWFVLLTLLKT